jgi:hypothetical protein
MPARFAIALVAILLPATLLAQEPKLPSVKEYDRLVRDSLREAHNKGAELYNDNKDFVGAYRIFQGALLTIRPLLPHHPAAQKMIDDGLAAAAKEARVDQKAHRLHVAIEAVREHLKGEPAKKPEEKKPEGKKTEKPPMTAGGGPGFRGVVTLKGQPLAAGSVIFVSLDKPKPVVIAAEIQGNGQYAPMEVVPPGKYVVIVQGKGVPEKYQLTTTSGLTVDVQAPPMVYDIVLQ